MVFIRNKIIKEGMAANPLDKSISKDQDITKIAQEGILTAIAAETDAINQYDQIKDLISKSEDWFSKKAMPVIEDIISEEKKHLAQLTELVKQLPAYEEDMKKGEEETKSGEDISESISEKTDPVAEFDFVDIYDIVDDYYDDVYGKDTDESDEAQHNFYRAIKGFVKQGGMIDAESVDLLLNKFIKDDLERSQIEDKIIAITNYRRDLDKEFDNLFVSDTENLEEPNESNQDIENKEFYSKEEIIDILKDKVSPDQLEELIDILDNEYPNGMHRSEFEREVLSDL